MSEEASSARDATPAAPAPLRWVRAAVFAAITVIGWVFILSQNQFRITAPVVFVCLGFLAVVASVWTLWRIGVLAVSDEDDAGDSTWSRPIGVRGELEREKRSLLKAIKEAEFDREMGKLSKGDADTMIALYRVRAIEVIKELDRLEAGAAGTVREQIEREVKARLEIARTKGAAKARGRDAEAATEAATEAKTAVETAAEADAAPVVPQPGATIDAKTDSKIDSKTKEAST